MDETDGRMIQVEVAGRTGSVTPPEQERKKDRLGEEVGLKASL